MSSTQNEMFSATHEELLLLKEYTNNASQRPLAVLEFEGLKITLLTIAKRKCACNHIAAANVKEEEKEEEIQEQHQKQEEQEEEEEDKTEEPQLKRLNLEWKCAGQVWLTPTGDCVKGKGSDVKEGIIHESDGVKSKFTVCHVCKLARQRWKKKQGK